MDKLLEIGVDKSESSRLKWTPVMVGTGHSCLCILPPGALPGSHCEDQRKIHLCFEQAKEKKECAVLLNKACLQEKVFNHTLSCWGFLRA